MRKREMAAGETSYTAPASRPPLFLETFYYVDPDIFLESPQWEEGERGPVFHASSPLQNVGIYLEQHPEIAFVFYKDYDPLADRSKIMSKDGVFRIPKPLKQTLMLTSEHMVSAAEQLGRRIPDFDNLSPNFDPYAEIPAPYTFIYHSIPLFDHVVPHLTPLGIELLEMLNENVLASHGKEYLAAKQYQAKGIVSRRLVKYLVRLGDVLVSTQDSVLLAYVATTWAKEEAYKEDVSNPDEGRLHKINAEKRKGPKIRTYNFRVAAWSWAFDGPFEQKRITIQIQLKVGDEDNKVSITSRNYFPLRFSLRIGYSNYLRKGERYFGSAAPNVWYPIRMTIMVV